ncbi:MAG TPA: DNA polymerase III subunit gamma/tau [Acidimicrobiales bacterium]|nr:DNA polymerase III subunit gamma/tau [Acidimicrobiales bacterium]
MEADAVGSAPVDGVTSLYRRFRPGTFAELRGQDHVVRALRTAVATDRVAHAYLFSGPRGTGKTSSARILAKALNCERPADGEPCGVCQSCVGITKGTSLDVTELDAASTNGVDAIRDLVSHAALGTPGRWKVYIVDEVHMLSPAAANALLKTVEEPPPHVVFVLATTDPQKVPATMRSRTQHLEFRLLSGETLHQLLVDVRDAAALEVPDDALDAAVRRGHGSARDALSALDQVAASGEADDVRPDLDVLFDAVAAERATDVLASLAVLHAAGWSASQLATEACNELRQAFLLQLAPDVADAAGSDRARLGALGEALGLPRTVRALETLGRAMVEMRDAPDPTVVLEIALVRLARPELDPSPAALLERLERIERGATAPSAPTTPPPPERQRPALGELRGGSRPRVAAPAASPPAAPAAPDAAPRAAPGVPGDAAAVGPDRDALTLAWGDAILATLSPRARSLYVAGRFTESDGRSCTFAVDSEAQREHCERKRTEVEGAIAAHFGTRVALRLVVDAAVAAPATTPPDTAAGASLDRLEVDLDEMDGGVVTDTESIAAARVLDAFPGATEVVS